MGLLYGYLLLGLILASLPWMLMRHWLLVVRVQHKTPWLCIAEWLVWYALYTALGLGIELRQNATLHAKDWEFYAVTLLVFAVFAAPGVIYQYTLKRYL